MVREDGDSIARTVSQASSAETQPEEQYDSLKRSLSRMHNASRSDFPRSPILTRAQHGLKRTQSGANMHLDLPQTPNIADTVLAAMQFLPTPLLVLSSWKTVVLANEAMGRLLGLFENTDLPHDTVIDGLKGQSLSQIGIDMISDGVPVWVSWDKFLDNLASGASADPPLTPSIPSVPSSGESTPSTDQDLRRAASPQDHPTNRDRSPLRERAPIQDTAVDVVISSSHMNRTTSPHHRSNRHHKPRSPGTHATCRMIITIWNLDDQRFFTLTFTASTHQHTTKHIVHHAKPHIASRPASTASTKSLHAHSSATTPSSVSSSVVTSPTENSTGPTSFPPNGAPAKCSVPSTFTDFQKVTRMKDAMLGAMEIPVIAMWRDESVVFPNQAARKLLAVTTDPTSDESYDFMSRFNPWTADFSRELIEDENPILKLCRTQKRFSKWQIGLINSNTGKHSTYDVSGHPVFDEKTGEFFAGLVAFKDVTEYTEKLASQTAESEHQFQLICDTMPQMIWTTRPDGYHDYFSQRWYDYTGLKPEECCGHAWVSPFHPDDVKIAGVRWKHSLETGDEYLTEYRCKGKDGSWRWMLGRALPYRDSKTGKIVKWFGTCTDIQDIVDARETTQRSRQQLVDVLTHAHMTMWIIDKNGILTFFEGNIEDAINPEQAKTEIVGKPASEAFGEYLDTSKYHDFFTNLMTGKNDFEMFEVKDAHDRWFRIRLMPQHGGSVPGESLDTTQIVGVIGTCMEVTAMKKKEQENIILLANENAAKESSKMKSSFLANMSHEIRTPIAGVLGMSELLMDTELDQEQREFAQNIQRSANSLLTVINDILDFSKIESGRLDIEEVQFSLPIVLKDVAKMLSYAAARKNLSFTSEILLGEQDLPLLGDPGRIRQILTNLLTNSIKFTTDGFVKMKVQILENNNDNMVIEFRVEDTGIGIEEEVKKRLFRPFSQADSSTARRFGGTGLGLTISKNLVDLMHGKIWLESKLDHGTTAGFIIPFKKPEFSNGSHTPLVELVALPERLHSELSLSVDGQSRPGSKGHRLSPPAPQSPQSADSVRAIKGDMASTAELERDQFHVLVVEDNTVNQQIALKFIKGLRFSVSAVWNGREALQYLLRATSPNLSVEERAKYPIPSLILMDCQMPVLDGYHTTHVLRHHAPYTEIEAIRRIPIIAMTASAIQGDREKCERAGMDDYLAKPVKKPVLERMLLKWVSNHTQTTASKDNDGTMTKPGLYRTGTEHSSTCADLDIIANEILGFQNPPAPPQSSDGIDPPQRPPLIPGGHPTSYREMRRTSLKEHILANEIHGLGTEAEESAKRAAHEEKAVSLRDAKLIDATRSPLNKTPPDAHYKSPILGNDNEEAISPLPKSYPTQGYSEVEGGILALTKENVQKLNHAAVSPGGSALRMHGPEDYFTQGYKIGHNSGLDKHETVFVPVSNIPGPPPDVASPGAGIKLITSEDIPQSVKQKTKTASPQLKRTITDHPKVNNTRETLRIKERSASDWSSSDATIRPEFKRQNSASTRFEKEGR